MGMGDDLMVTAAARAAQSRDPRRIRITKHGRVQWGPVYERNPRLARPEEEGDFQELAVLDRAGNRPYHTGKTPERWHYNPAFRAEPGELYFAPSEQKYGARFAGYVLIEPHIKPGASPNKQWGWDRWIRLAQIITAARIPVAQLSPAGTRAIPGIETIQPGGFRLACSALAAARAAVLPEGGLHHAAAALRVPAVVIFGGFTPVELTGYAGHVNLGVGVQDACGMRRPCPHCEAVMAGITPERVAEALFALMKGAG